MRSIVLPVTLLLLAGLVGFGVGRPDLVERLRGGIDPANAAPPDSRPNAPLPATRPAPPIAVRTATAVTQDVPIYLDGLGTAQASALVTVHSRVEGALLSVDFKEGQDVHVGDVLGRIDPRTYQAALDQAVARKQQDESQLANAKLDYGRTRALARDAFASSQRADTDKAAVAQLTAQVAQDQAQIDRAAAELSYTTITAPLDGRTGIRQVDAGNVVHPSDPNGIAVITALRPISVVFTLPQQRLGEVTDAMRAGAAEVLALQQGDDSAVLDRGKLTVVDNQVDQTTGTIKLKAAFSNEGLRLWPGAFVTVRLKVDLKHDAVTIPPLAIQRGPSGPFIYVVQSDMTVARRTVRLSHQDQFTAIVEDGVATGEQVVTDGASRLSDGALVTVLEPAGGPTAAARLRPPGKT